MLEREELLPHRIAREAERRPDEPAIVDVGGPTCSWGRLHGESLRWAAAYRSLRVAPGSTVVTMVAKSIDSYLVWFGAAWLGAIEVPVNNMYRGDMLRYVLNDSRAELLVISSGYLDRLVAVASELEWLKFAVVVEEAGGDAPGLADLPELPFEVLTSADLLGANEPADGLAGPDAWDVTAMIYTSGTTGPSKGVLVPWGELHYFANSMPRELVAPGEGLYSTDPVFHISGKNAFYIASMLDARFVMRRAFSASEFWNDVRAHNVTGGSILGPIASILLATPEQPDDADNPWTHCMMSPIIPAVETFKRRFGIRHVGGGFGSTEMGLPIVCPWDPPNHRTVGRHRGASPYEIRLVDEHDRPVPTGSTGELIVRSREPWTMNIGYWRQPEKTADAWRNGWFHTGDALREDDDGWLYFVDRVKDSLRRRGENISSFEVEAGILQHPSVAECAVVGVPSELGEDDVKAVIVLVAGESVEPGALIEFLIPRMPRFMIPRYIEITDSLPRTEATSRIRKVELRQDPLNERTWDREAAGVAMPKN